MSASAATSEPVIAARGPWAAGGKRICDVLLALLLMVLLLPLFVIIGAAIVLESPGSPFFVDDRVGRGGQRIRMWKFRTLVTDAQKHALGRKMLPNDPRVTKVGRLLRRSSLDELPQLWNILIGEMSIVGPRPGLWEHYAQYSERQRARLLVRPGVTGLAQVRGRNTLEWARRIEVDIEYIQRLSFALDVRILLATVRTVLRGDGVYSAHQQRDGL